MLGLVRSPTSSFVVAPQILRSNCAQQGAAGGGGGGIGTTVNQQQLMSNGGGKKLDASGVGGGMWRQLPNTRRRQTLSRQLSDLVSFLVDSHYYEDQSLDDYANADK